jgi:hypothetical protein
VRQKSSLSGRFRTAGVFGALQVWRHVEEAVCRVLAFKAPELNAEITRSCALNFVVGFSMAYSRRQLLANAAMPFS